MYSYFNPNPNGRNVSDCTVRAICKATRKDWGEVYLALCIQGYLDGDLPNANACWGAYLRSLGYRRYIIPDTCPDCYTVGKFADEHRAGRIFSPSLAMSCAFRMGQSMTAGTARTKSRFITG